MCTYVFFLCKKSFDMILINNPSFYDWGVTMSCQPIGLEVRPRHDLIGVTQAVSCHHPVEPTVSARTEARICFLFLFFS
jgi:hypothetical protein